MMKNKKSSRILGRIECNDATIVLKSSNLIITKSSSRGLSKLSWQTIKVKLRKKTRRWTENKLELFAKVLAEPENSFTIF